MSVSKLTKSKAAKVAPIDDEAEVKRLVSRFKEGDESAFAELVSLYRSQVASLAYRMVGDYDEAADIAQDVFVKMARNVWRYDSRKRFYTWLYRITVNAAIDHIRKHKRHKHESLENLHDTFESFEPTPEILFRRKQIDACIKSAADELNPKQRSAFWLRDVEGNKVDEVAQIMNMPQATVRWYLHRARARIRRELRRKCPHLLYSLGVK
jgi:RNA polymerase sigma-70 factor (ECF subfamily)